MVDQLHEKIRQAQVAAGENAVMDFLREKGLAAPEPPQPDPRDAELAELRREIAGLNASIEQVAATIEAGGMPQVAESIRAAFRSRAALAGGAS